jgi:hypothetical protein
MEISFKEFNFEFKQNHLPKRGGFFIYPILIGRTINVDGNETNRIKRTDNGGIPHRISTRKGD